LGLVDFYLTVEAEVAHPVACRHTRAGASGDRAVVAHDVGNELRLPASAASTLRTKHMPVTKPLGRVAAVRRETEVIRLSLRPRPARGPAIHRGVAGEVGGREIVVVDNASHGEDRVRLLANDLELSLGELSNQVAVRFPLLRSNDVRVGQAPDVFPAQLAF